MTELSFTVYGKPEPAGSKRAFAIRRGGELTGQVAVSDANPRAKSWQREVADAAREAMQLSSDWTPLDVPVLCPVAVSMTFYARRPKGHYGTGRNAAVLKPSAPLYPIGRPDALKLSRGTEDACTGLVWRDDAQVVDLRIGKRYGLPERCEIVVQTIPAVATKQDRVASSPRLAVG